MKNTMTCTTVNHDEDNQDSYEFFTGKLVQGFCEDELVRCKNCLAFLHVHALEEYREAHGMGCPLCGHDEFYTHKDRGFHRIEEEKTIKIE
jgi:hypothetical protein